MASCELKDIDDEEFTRLTHSQSHETTVKRVNNAPPLPEGMRYHLFISHSNDTEDEINWAKGVVRTLEDDFGLKCLLPSRDFKPGHDILTQITDGIVKSAKIICVFTPESLESNYCEYERKLALNLSLNMERGKIIPVLFKNCEIPDMFRFMNYIDVLNGEDYIQRILGSFNDTDVPNMERVLHEIVETSKRRFEEKNHDRLPGVRCSLYGQRIQFRGAAWSFKRVQAYERRMLGILKNKFSEELYNKARDIANRSQHLRYYSLTSEVRRTPFIFILLTLAIALPVILCILVVERTKQVFVISQTFDIVQILNLALVFLPCAFVVILFMICFYCKAFLSLKEEIRSLCLQEVLESNLLVKYGNERGARDFFGPPCIAFMIYDIQPCLIYMTEFYIVHSKKEATEELRIRWRKHAEMQILWYLRQNIDVLFQWSDLQTSTVHRHPTCESKACLCEILLPT